MNCPYRFAEGLLLGDFRCPPATALRQRKRLQDLLTEGRVKRSSRVFITRERGPTVTLTTSKRPGL